MKRSDSHIVEFSLESIWRALSNRAAVCVAAATALCALIANAPVHIACLRGGVAWVGVLVLSRMFGYALKDAPITPLDKEEEATSASK